MDTQELAEQLRELYRREEDITEHLANLQQEQDEFFAKHELVTAEIEILGHKLLNAIKYEI